MRLALRLAAFAVLAALYGCSTPLPPPTEPAQDPAPAPNVILPSEPTAYELRQQERAVALARQGRLADAALVWEVLATIRPKVPEYRERLADTKRQIDTAVVERMQRADQAAARGQLDAAAQQYLAALALQPDNARAADSLRGIERERNKRNYLGKLSRNTLTKRAMADAEMVVTADSTTEETPSPAAKSGADSEDRNAVEHASILASEGEWDEAITLLERRLKANRRDASARALLANVYFQKAEAIAPRNRSAAITLLERSVRTDPSNARASERLKQLRPLGPTSPTAVAKPAAAASSVSPSTAITAVKPAAATMVGPAASTASPRR